MFNRRRLPLIVAGTCLLLASGASAADEAINAFTAAATPTHVKPATSASYTIRLTNDPGSDPKGADRATIVPDGFEIIGQPATPSVSGCGNPPPPWVAEVAPDGKTITLRRTGGSANNLCPGGSLKVDFSAKSPVTEKPYTWPTEMFHDAVPFPNPPQLTVVVDGTPPDTTISSGPPTPTNQTSAGFTFTSNDAGSTFKCSLDGGAFIACASYSGLAEGPHSFQVRATDLVGNTDATPATYSWTIDLTAPTVAISGKPSNPSNSTSASFAFTVSESEKVECKLDGAAFALCTSPTSYSGLADGPHTFTVRAIDAAGNPAEASYTWTIETRAPTAAVASGPAALSNSRSATFAFSADEPSSFQCQLDGGGFQTCSSPASYQGLGDGAHTFSVRPTDAVGNIGVSSSYGWSIDANAPETTLGSGPASGTTTLSATFKFSASEPAAFECKLDGAAFAPCTSPKSHAGLNRSEHTFEVRAIDAAGNPDPTPAIHRWTIAAAPRRAQTTSALLAPRAGARVTSPPLLVWRRAARASYYNVQLYRGRVKVLSSWPTRTRLQLRARWTYLGRQRRLSPGTYRWYVWPGYGRPSARRYGRLLGQSSFTMAALRRR